MTARTAARSGVDTAYTACEEITGTQARNFSYGIRLLPRPKRRMLSAVYAFARRIDDIGDGDLPAPEKLARLAAADAAIRRLDDGAPAPSGDPVLVALADTRMHGVPLDPFLELVDGCRDDVLGRTYRTEDELYDYCRKVAGSVGRLSLAVFGAGPRRPRAAGHPVATGAMDPGPEALADALGVALQLTNILRDVLEDARGGRVYLPRQDLERFGCRFELDSACRLTDDPADVAALVRFEAARAHDWYGRGLRLLPLLDRRSRACCAALAGIYLRLLERIDEDPARVLRGRTSLPTRTKLAVAGRALLAGQA